MIKQLCLKFVCKTKYCKHNNCRWRLVSTKFVITITDCMNMTCLIKDKTNDLLYFDFYSILDFRYGYDQNLTRKTKIHNKRKTTMIVR